MLLRRLLLPLTLACTLGAQAQPQPRVLLQEVGDARTQEFEKVAPAASPEYWEETVVRVFLDAIKQDLQRYALDKVKSRLVARLEQDAQAFTESLKVLKDMDSWEETTVRPRIGYMPWFLPTDLPAILRDGLHSRRRVVLPWIPRSGRRMGQERSEGDSCPCAFHPLWCGNAACVSPW